MKDIFKRYSAGALALSLCIGAAATRAGAKEEKVELAAVPHFMQQEIEKATKGATHVEIIKITEEGRPEEAFTARYVADGKQMILRLDATGQVLEKGESPEQRHKDEEAKVGALTSEKEKVKAKEELAAQREKEDREKFEAYKAAHATEAGIHPENAERTFPNMKELSEEYNAKDLRRIPASELPPGPRKTLEDESLGGTDVDFYKYSAEGTQFYSAHYNTSAGRRLVCRVDQNGKLLGKNEVGAPPAPPPGLDYKAVSLPPSDVGQMPPAVQETMKRELRGGKDFAYYKITRHGSVFLTVHYTTPENHRYDLWLDPEGQVVSHLLCVLQPGDRDYKRYEWGG